MAKELIVKPFDYSLVEKDVAGKLRYHAGQLSKRKKAHAEVIIETGRELTEVQSLLADHSDGVFILWVESECGFGKSTAYNYIAAFETFGSCPNFGQLEPSAMYLLASSDAAAKVAIKMANKGKPVSHAVAKGLVAEAKASEPAADKPPKSKPLAAEPITVDAESVTSTQPPGEPCPNCGGTKWTEDTSGLACAACSHPHGEPLGDLDPGQPEWKTIQAKARKTFEAGLRVIDDLHQAKKKRAEHADTIATIKIILKTIREW